MQDDFIYYTLQGDYTLETLETTGSYFSTLENNYYLIDLVKHHFNSEGIVYYFKVKESCVEELPLSGRGIHLIKLNGKTLSKNRIEFNGNRFAKAMMMCDALCNNKFLRQTEGTRLTIAEILPELEQNFGVDFEFFKQFGDKESNIYVGLVDELTNKDIIEIKRNYREERAKKMEVNMNE